MLSPVRTSSLNKSLYQETTHCELHEQLHADAGQQGHADALFLNERGELTEGARKNLFVEIAGMLYTPLVECGLPASVCLRMFWKVSHAPQEGLSPRRT